MRWTILVVTVLFAIIARSEEILSSAELQQIISSKYLDLSASYHEGLNPEGAKCAVSIARNNATKGILISILSTQNGERSIASMLLQNDTKVSLSGTGVNVLWFNVHYQKPQTMGLNETVGFVISKSTENEIYIKIVSESPKSTARESACSFFNGK